MAKGLLELTRDLAQPGAPRALNYRQLGRLLGEPSESTVVRTLRRLTEGGILVRAMRNVYFNAMQPYELADALPLIVPEGVLSLNSVLGRAGISNNPSRNLHVVVPLREKGQASGFRYNSRRFQDGTRLNLYSLPGRYFDFGLESRETRFRAATPEKALCDWLYLQESPRSRVTRVPSDLEFDRFNRRRLTAYARRMGVEAALDTLEAAHAAEQAYYDAPDECLP